MPSIHQLHTPEITEKLHQLEKTGCVLKIKIFNVEGERTERDAHLLTAKQTLVEVQKDSNEYFDNLSKRNKQSRDTFYKVTIDTQVLENSGEIITPQTFFGPYLDWDTKKPIIYGNTSRYINNCFFYDTEEKEENIIIMNNKIKECNTSFFICGYTDAFLRPVHNFKVGTTILDEGTYFLSISDFLFSDFEHITVYSWNIDSSNFFDSGKEWWGSFFWTVYNPAKNWYIGIVASETD